MKTVRICYFGDSITLGLGHDERSVAMADRWTARVDRALGALEPRGVAIVSTNLGVNGDTTRNGLERLKDVYAFRPDILTLQFGMNDCNFWLTDNGWPRVNPISFEHNLREMIGKTRAAGARAMVLSTNHQIPAVKPMPNGQEYNANNRQYNTIVRRVAADEGVALCDIERAFETASFDTQNFLDENGRWVHLSASGQAVYASAILPFVERAVSDLTA